MGVIFQLIFFFRFYAVYYYRVFYYFPPRGRFFFLFKTILLAVTLELYTIVYIIQFCCY